MSLRIAVAAEGPTDHPVLAQILESFLGDAPAIHAVFPDPDATTLNGREDGGWTVLFHHLEAGGAEKALQFNDVLVLQVDTDRHSDVGFLGASVVYPEGCESEEDRVAFLVGCVRSKLESLMDPGLLAEMRDCIYFAIAVDSTECWLLPIFAPAKHADARKLTGCQSRVDHYLRKGNLPPLDKVPDRYRSAAKGYKKRKDLLKRGPRNPSLKLFLDELTRLQAYKDTINGT